MVDINEWYDDVIMIIDDIIMIIDDIIMIIDDIIMIIDDIIMIIRVATNQGCQISWIIEPNHH